MSDNKTRGDRRAETARQNDDSDIVEDAQDQETAAAEQQGREGGNMQRDVGTQADEERATDPNAHESLTKGDKIEHGHFTNEPHPSRHVVTERD